MELLTDRNKLADKIPVEVLEVNPEAEDTYTFRCKPGEDLSWEAGANAHLVVPEIRTVNSVEKDWRRHMSIMSTPDEGYMGFTTRIRAHSSFFKTSMINRSPGDRMHVYGIKNNFPLFRNGNHTVLLSMGVGMATMRPLIRSYMKSQEGIRSLTSLNVDRGVHGIYQDELESMEAPGLSVHYLENRNSFFDRVDRCLKQENVIYYLVGSDEFLSSMAYYLHGSGVSKAMIRIDKKPHKVRAILDAI